MHGFPYRSNRALNGTLPIKIEGDPSSSVVTAHQHSVAKLIKREHNPDHLDNSADNDYDTEDGDMKATAEDLSMPDSMVSQQHQQQQHIMES